MKTITDKFIELAIQVGNEVFNRAIDEPPVSAIIKETLARGGFEVCKLNGKREAVHKCPYCGEAFDVVHQCRAEDEGYSTGEQVWIHCPHCGKEVTTIYHVTEWTDDLEKTDGEEIDE